jgi:hypothetical protein
MGEQDWVARHEYSWVALTIWNMMLSMYYAHVTMGRLGFIR